MTVPSRLPQSPPDCPHPGYWNPRLRSGRAEETARHLPPSWSSRLPVPEAVVLVGARGFEPLTSSVSRNAGHICLPAETENPQVRATPPLRTTPLCCECAATILLPAEELEPLLGIPSSRPDPGLPLLPQLAAGVWPYPPRNSSRTLHVSDPAPTLASSLAEEGGRTNEVPARGRRPPVQLPEPEPRSPTEEGGDKMESRRMRRSGGDSWTS